MPSSSKEARAWVALAAPRAYAMQLHLAWPPSFAGRTRLCCPQPVRRRGEGGGGLRAPGPGCQAAAHRVRVLALTSSSVSWRWMLLTISSTSLHQRKPNTPSVYRSRW